MVDRPDNIWSSRARPRPVPEFAILLGSEEMAEEPVGTHRIQHSGPSAASVDDDEEEEEEDKDERWKALPWWRRPSPWWLLCAIPLSAVAKSATIAPKVEVYTMLACRVHKPDIYNSSHAVGHEALSDMPQDPTQASITFPLAPIRSDSSPEQSKLFVHLERAGRTPATPCAADPVVQAAVARLSAVIETTMGVLSLVTTGWWGAFADRHGRATILVISLCGLLVSDFNVVIVYLFSESLPGNSWFLLFGSLLEGMLGGFSTAVAAQHAYIAETSTDGTRARYLSLNLGLLFTGMAFGPTLGSLLIRATGKTISAFYFATLVHVFYAILIFVGLPEPLSKRRMKLSKLKYEEELRAGAEERQLGGMTGLYARARRLFQFLSPLGIFMPNFTIDTGRNPLKPQEKDWNLTLLAATYGFTISIMASFPYIFQYANATFGWTSEILGYWLSLVGGGRAVWLTICLPITIKFLKPKPMIIEIPARSRSALVPEEEPLLSLDLNEDEDTTPYPRSNIVKKEIHSPRFELGVARLSLGVDIVAYGTMAILASERSFGVFGILGAMGIGFSPAIQTLALAMYARRGGTETGRLFGALSVVQALSAQIFGPAFYGFVYIRTVATFPRAIFLAGLICVIISLVLISFIRLPQDKDLEKELLGVYYGGDFEEEGQLSEPPPVRGH